MHDQYDGVEEDSTDSEEELDQVSRREVRAPCEVLAFSLEQTE